MQYALINKSKVVDVILADAEFVQAISGNWDHIERIDTPAEQALGVGIGWGWDGSSFVAPDAAAPQPALAPAWEWLMDIGPFTDRLGAASVAIDVSTDPKLVAIRSDFGRRKWIDLKDPRVIAAVQYLAGQPHAVLGTMAQPLLTPEQIAAVLTTPVAPAENLALRKLYFS